MNVHSACCNIFKRNSRGGLSQLVGFMPRDEEYGFEIRMLR